MLLGVGKKAPAGRDAGRCHVLVLETGAPATDERSRREAQSDVPKRDPRSTGGAAKRGQTQSELSMRPSYRDRSRSGTREACSR